MKRNPVLRRCSGVWRCVALAIIADSTTTFLAVQEVQSAPLYWDLNGAAVNTSGPVSGTWDGINVLWNDSSTGTGGSTQAGTANGDDLIFSSGSIYTSGTITLTGPRIAGSISFEDNVGVTLSGGTSLTLGGSEANSGIFVSGGNGAAIQITTPIIVDSGTSTVTFSNLGQGLLSIGAGSISGSSAGTQTIQITASGAGGITLGGNIDNGSGGGDVELNVNSTGTGLTTLTGTNTFTGSVTLTSGTVSVSNSANLGGINTLVFNGGTLKVAGAGLASFGTHTPTFTASKTVGLEVESTFTISEVLNQTTGGLTKTGNGMLTLNGASTYTGATTLTAGTLALSGAAGSIKDSSAITLGGNANLTLINGTAHGIVDRVGDGSLITSHGGNINYNNTPASGAVYAETIGSLTLTNGLSNVVLSSNMSAGGGNMQTLTLSDLTQTDGGTVAFSVPTTGPNATTNVIKVSGAAQTPSGQIIGPWATTGTTTSAQTDYAVYDAFSRIVPSGIAATSENTWSAGGDVTLSAGTSLTEDRTLNSLRYTGSTGTLTLGANNMEISGILHAGSNTLTISSTSGVIRHPGNLPSNLYVIAANKTIIISAPIQDHVGALTLVKSGFGPVILSGVNAFSGGAVVNAGSLSLSGGGSITGDFDISSGAGLSFSGGAHTLSGGATFDVSSGASVSFAGGTTTLGGGTTISASSGASVSFTGGTTTLSEGTTIGLSSGAGITFSDGTHTLNGGAAIIGAGWVSFAGATVNADGSALASTGQVSLSGGTLNIAGDNHFNNFSWAGGIFGGGGITNIPSGGVATILGNTHYLNGRTLNNAGTVTWTGFGQIRAYINAPTINNLSGGVFDAQSDTNINVFFGTVGTSVFNNFGLLRKSLSNGTTAIDFVFHNSGAVEVQSGTLSFGGSGCTSTGTFSVAPGATLHFGGGMTISNPSGLPSSGVTLSGGLSISGDNTFTELNWSGGSLSGAGTTTIAPGGTLSLNAAGFPTFDKFLSGRALNNFGTLTWRTGSWFSAVGDAVINNQPGGVFEIGNGAFLRATGTSPQTMNNGGTFIKAAGNSTSSVSLVFNNTGTVQVPGGTLSLSGGGASTGSFDVSSGATLNFSGGTHTLSGGAAVTGVGGMTTVTAGTLSLNGRVSSPVSINRGTLGGSGDGATTGLIEGNVTIGNNTGGAGAGTAILSPGNGIGTLSTLGQLTVNSDGAFNCEMNSDLGTGDKMTANGVTIDSSARFLPSDLGSTVLALGTVFLAIDNTSAVPIAGTFANLPEGRLLTVGANHFQASYLGNTGNDLVLTIVALSYSGWAIDFELAGPDADPGSDPDYDGISNLLEYALGSDPLHGNVQALPVVSIMTVSQENYLALTFSRPLGVNQPSDLSYTVERSTDLAAQNAWSTSGVVLVSVSSNAQTLMETVVMRSATPISSGVAEFLRLKVTKL